MNNMVLHHKGRKSRFLVVLIIIVLLLTSCQNFDRQDTLQPTLIQYEEPQTAILNAIAVNYAKNLDKPSEMFYEYTLYNYGELEAKNVTVTCWLTAQGSQKAEAVVRHNAGNIASNSMTAQQAFGPSKGLVDSKIYSYVCFPTSCNGECDLLYTHIPLLADMVDQELGK